MKRFLLSLLAITTCVVTEQIAFGQQDCECNQGDSGYQSDSIYQAAEWDNSSSRSGRQCQQHSRRSSRARGSRLASLWTRPLFPNSCASRCCASKGFPDAGWNAPAHLPVNYDGVWYGSYLPQNAYGTQGGGFIANYPSVYQPTDTTQLGYYYAKVPTWQSRTDMIPSTPNPANFHSRVAPQNGTGMYSNQGTIYSQFSQTQHSHHYGIR